MPGVTSISVDLHKYGYTAKGASVIMHRNKQLRSYQTFVTDNWLGGMYGSSGVLGTKGGGAMAAAWAVMHYLGDDGYLRADGRGPARLRANSPTAIDAMPELPMRGRARGHAAGVRRGRPGRTRRVRGRRRAVAPRLVRRPAGPARRRCTARSTRCTTARSPAFVADLRAGVAEVLHGSQHGEQGAYGTIE